MTNVPATTEVAQNAVTPTGLPELPGCGSPATTRFEIYRTRDGSTYGDLAGTVNVCGAHAEAAKTAVSSVGFLPFLVDSADGRSCGSGMDFAGDRPEPLESRHGTAYPDFGRVHDVDQAHAEALAVDATRPVSPAETVSAAAAGQPALVRIARANMLRAISRKCFAVERSALPAPETVAFFGTSQAVDLEFSTMAQAEAWAVELGADRDAQISENRDATGTLYRGYRTECTWRGFEVTLAAIERAEQLPAAAATA